MSEEYVIVEKPRRGARGLTGAVILIALGVAFLLNNLGITSFDWFSLWRYWPVILVLIGLDLLLGRSLLGSLLAAVIALALVGGILFLASTHASRTPLAVMGRPATREVVQQEMDDIDALTVEINLGAGEATLAALADSPYMVDGTYTTREDLALDVDYRTSGTTGYLTLSQEESRVVMPLGDNFVGRLDIGLTDAVPVDLILNTGASSITLDLSGIQLRSLTIKGGVGEVNLILPEEGTFEANIETGIGHFVVTVPRHLAARVDVEAGLSNVNVASWFEKQGDGEWTTPAYEPGRDSATIEIRAGIGNVNIR